MSDRITTYNDSFEGILGIKFDDKLKSFVKSLEAEGHTEKSIAFTIWKKQEKLLVYKNDRRFFAVLRGEVNKYSWKKGDPRWEEYWKKKNEEEKVRKYSQALSAYHNDIKNNPKLEQKAFSTKAKKGGYVYFIQGLYGGAIKIGYSKEPDKRLKTLQTGYPDTLRILLLIPGNETTEKYFHREFEMYKLSGEWFKPERELLSRIKELKKQYEQEN